MEYLVIGIGGFLGANARYVVAAWAAQHFATAFPYGTFIVNISGSFILGLFMALFQERAFIPPNYRLFFTIGFLGAYTTFSTFTYESFQLLQNGSMLLALINICSSMIVGLVGVYVGFVCGRML